MGTKPRLFITAPSSHLCAGQIEGCHCLLLKFRLEEVKNKGEKCSPFPRIYNIGLILLFPHILYNMSELRPIEMDSIPPFERSPKIDRTRPIVTTEILN